MRVGAVLPGLVLAVCLLVQGAQAASAPLAALNVRQADLPRSAILIADRDETTAEYAASTRAPYRREGLQRAHLRGFIAVSDLSTTLLSGLQQYATPAQAHAEYARWHTDAIRGKDARDRFVASGPIGDERFVESGIDNARKPPRPVVVAFVRRGRYVAVMFLYSPSKTFGPAQLIRVARIVDARINAAH